MKKLILFSLLCILLFPLCSFAANDGTPYGGVTFGAPKYGSASGSFDGVDDYVEVPDNASLNFGSSDFTVEVWIKTTNTGSQQIISKGSSGEGYYEIGIAGVTAGKLYIYAACSVIDILVETTVNVSDGAWHFLEIIRRGNVFELWVDNSLDASGSRTFFSSVESPSNVLIANGVAGHFSGLIDELAVYNVALSSETIASHYNSTNYQADVSNTSGLVSYWRFDNDFLDAPISSVPLTDSELLQQIKDVLDQIDAKTQAIKDVTAGSTAVDWNKTMSFVVGTLSSLAFVFASRMIL